MKSCDYCGGDIEIRNPTGFCDHLYYPEKVNRNLSQKNRIFALEVEHPEQGWIQFGLHALLNPDPLFSTRNTIIPLLNAGARVRAKHMMTPEQEIHLQQIKDRVCQMIDEKYRAGAAKHGTNMADLSFDRLMSELRMEIIDMMVYWAAAELKSEQLSRNAQS